MVWSRGQRPGPRPSGVGEADGGSRNKQGIGGVRRDRRCSEARPGGHGREPGVAEPGLTQSMRARGAGSQAGRDEGGDGPVAKSPPEGTKRPSGSSGGRSQTASRTREWPNRQSATRGAGEGLWRDARRQLQGPSPQGASEAASLGGKRKCASSRGVAACDQRGQPARARSLLTQE